MYQRLDKMCGRNGGSEGLLKTKGEVEDLVRQRTGRKREEGSPEK